MKQKSIFQYFLICSAFFVLIACNNDSEDDSSYMLEWQAETRLQVLPTENKETYIWYYDLLTEEEYWGNDTVELKMKLNSSRKISELSKIDFYVTAEEKDGYNYSAPFDAEGKLVKTMDVPESGDFMLELKAEDVYELFKTEFHNDRSSTLARKNDIFLVYWVITAEDGTVLDSRNYENYGRYGINVRVEDYAPPVWEGTFQFEWIEASGGALSWGGIWIGKTGTVDIINLGDGKYSMTNLMWDYKWGGPGYIYFDFISGLTYVEGGQEEKWTISNINGASMDIAFTYSYSEAYDETGSVRFTRTDGNNWPTNIYTD